ncbi:putative bifunctional diguanylate cyclase/phosphodiesterase [Kineococcus rhizosphaerae]|uniref:PAS domain S-box-containing protein/diguanylate cyclase (GGDEF)-like protein n=1 Tax=Kineococcus rhizosphaerae TaxID=559628 RepID=A0A2T0R5E8_9ACTN|nr:EAL domain-containing protein [Kineococcus rhizosphaerae]PRY15992.1 PAS domain S-box-containing protein/diguanylate cyclase (GGDEF)-like protein [Kineococcus rhizosphaerae]
MSRARWTRLGEQLRGLGLPAVSPSYEALAREASDEVLVTDEHGRVRFLSPSFSRRWNLDRWALVGRDAFDWVHPDDRAGARALLARACAPGAVPVDSDHRYLVRATGEVRWCRARFSDARAVAGVRGVVWNCRDTTEERRALEALRHSATHDSLTGLPNRRRLFDAFPAAGTGCGLLLLDLDGLKAVNDRLGHDAGDEVVRRLAGRLTDVVGSDGVVARLDGDEFAVLVQGEEAAVGRSLAVLADRVLRIARDPVTVAGRSVRVTLSAGSAVREPAAGHEDPREVFRRADTALGAAKARGRDRCVPFSRALLDAAHERAELAADLRQAVAAGELHVAYQPLVDLARGGTVGFEALVRWQHPQRGNVPPAVFVPLAEESETILQLGEFVLDSALAAAARFRTTAGTSPEVSVNLSGHQLQQPGIEDLVARALRRHDVDPARLCLEVTESAAVADLSAARDTLQGLRSLGVRTALDDFGTGYSSLSYLRRLPVDILKIDKSFLDDLADERGGAGGGHGVAVLAGIASLAGALGLLTVAEGIETDRVRELVARAGCTWGQGYHFARPLSEDAAHEHLRQNVRWRSTTA